MPEPTPSLQIRKKYCQYFDVLGMAKEITRLEKAVEQAREQGREAEREKFKPCIDILQTALDIYKIQNEDGENYWLRWKRWEPMAKHALADFRRETPG